MFGAHLGAVSPSLLAGKTLPPPRGTREVDATENTLHEQHGTKQRLVVKQLQARHLEFLMVVTDPAGVDSAHENAMKEGMKAAGETAE